MSIISDRDQVRQEVAAGDWDILWGDEITELDAITFLASLPSGTTAAWVAEKIEAQIQKFAQSSADISPEIIDQAALILEGIAKGKWLGEWDINGLEIKSGVATYRRWFEFGFWRFHLPGKKRLMNHYQPYIALRVAKPLPVKGASVATFQIRKVDLPTQKSKFRQKLVRRIKGRTEFSTADML